MRDQDKGRRRGLGEGWILEEKRGRKGELSVRGKGVAETERRRLKKRRKKGVAAKELTEQRGSGRRLEQGKEI